MRSAACLGRASFFVVLILLFFVPAHADPINQVGPGTLSGIGMIDMEDVPGASLPGASYNAVMGSGGAEISERFVGQALSYAGDFDVLSGTPSNPLTLQAGDPGQNIMVYESSGNQALAGLGPAGYPNFAAIGEGSLAVLFQFDQSEVGFDVIGANKGIAIASFFRRDGSLIQSIPLGALTDGSFGFRRDGGIQDIAGLTVVNNDPSGIAIDNIVHDVPGISGVCPDNPDPATSAYWHRNCLAIPASEGGIDPGRNGRGPTNPSEPDFQVFLMDVVDTSLENNLFLFGSCAEGMHASPTSDKCEQAIREYTALLFNLAAGRVGNACSVDLGNEGCAATTVGGMVTELAAMINTADRGICATALKCGAAVNGGNGALGSNGNGSGQLEYTVGHGKPEVGDPLSPAPDPAGAEVAAPEDFSVAPASQPSPESRMAAVLMVQGSTDPPVAGRKAAAGEPIGEDDEPDRTLQRLIAVLANASAPARAREVARDALLTALGGGYDVEARLAIVEALAESIDVAYHSLLAGHLGDIREEALELDLAEIANRAETLRERLESSGP